MPIQEEYLVDLCGIGRVLDLVGGRWKGPTIWWLRAAPRRFSDLRKVMPTISQRVLTVQLRQMERDGIIEREQFGEKPTRVVYKLTSFGEELATLLDVIREWTTNHTFPNGSLEEQ